MTNKPSKDMDRLITSALRTFPAEMTRKDVVKHCRLYVYDIEPLIWISHVTFAAHVVRHPDCAYDSKTGRYTNYQVKDIGGKLRVT